MKYRYYVVVKDPQFKPAIHSELISNYGSEFVPSRRVTAAEPMMHSEYNGVYMLTREEAQQLKNDPRVLDVERDPEEIGISARPLSISSGNYNKDPNSLSTTHRNWGLMRSISRSENFGAANSLTNFTYNLDGDGVDIVVLDTGIQKYHPEFAVNPDGTGGTRVVDINWAQFGAVSNNGTGSWVGDIDGHGSNCASIAAGITCGWAKKARIYAINMLDPNLPSTYMSPLQALQSVRLFHQSKSVNPVTGYKRPTVCTNSWGYELVYTDMTATVWRGATYAVSGPANAYGQVSASGSPPQADDPDTTHGYRSPSLEAEIQSCINAGVIMLGAAGNQAHKIDVPGGLDYDNRYIDVFDDSWYYHRGSTPGATSNVICVGSTSYSLPEHKVSYSNTGPRVDVFAPGLAIAGAWINQTVGGIPAVVDSRSSASTTTNYTFHNTVVSGDVDYVTITVGPNPITALYLTKYVSTDTRAWFAVQEGSAWTIPQNQITPQMLAYGHFGPGGSQPVGTNVLASFNLTLKANTTYTFWIQQTGQALTEYVFSTNPSDVGGTLPSDYSSNPLVPTIITGVPVTNFYLQKVGGTSMACPQVAGVVACMLQSRPWYNQWQTAQWVKEVATVNTLDETFYGGVGYTQYGGLQGAENKQLFQPFRDSNPWSISSSST